MPPTQLKVEFQHEKTFDIITEGKILSLQYAGKPMKPTIKLDLKKHFEKTKNVNQSSKLSTVSVTLVAFFPDKKTKFYIVTTTSTERTPIILGVKFGRKTEKDFRTKFIGNDFNLEDIRYRLIISCETSNNVLSWMVSNVFRVVSQEGRFKDVDIEQFSFPIEDFIKWYSGKFEVNVVVHKDEVNRETFDRHVIMNEPNVTRNTLANVCADFNNDPQIPSFYHSINFTQGINQPLNVEGINDYAHTFEHNQNSDTTYFDDFLLFQNGYQPQCNVHYESFPKMEYELHSDNMNCENDVNFSNEKILQQRQHYQHQQQQYYHQQQHHQQHHIIENHVTQRQKLELLSYFSREIEEPQEPQNERFSKSILTQVFDVLPPHLIRKIGLDLETDELSNVTQDTQSLLNIIKNLCIEYKVNDEITRDLSSTISNSFYLE